jgi:hypothetical protein
MIQNPQPNVDDRQGQGVEGLIAAIAVQAVEDLRDHRQHIREDAAAFFYDGRFDLVATSLPRVDPDAAREKLRARGLLP